VLHNSWFGSFFSGRGTLPRRDGAKSGRASIIFEIDMPNIYY
jgi:hypothetical protein